MGHGPPEVGAEMSIGSWHWTPPQSTGGVYGMPTHWATATVLHRPWSAQSFVNEGSHVPDSTVRHGWTMAGLPEGPALCASDADAVPAVTTAIAAADADDEPDASAEGTFHGVGPLAAAAVGGPTDRRDGGPVLPTSVRVRGRVWAPVQSASKYEF